MDRFKQIYSNHAETYHRLIKAEDVDNNLQPVIENMLPDKLAKVLDLGSGTGRIPLMLNEHVAQVVGLDLHQDMVHEQQRQMGHIKNKWGLIMGDMRELPFPDHSFDCITAGWALGHFVGWFDKDWKTQIARTLREMFRVVIPGGSLIIIETLSTGSLNPMPPSSGLAAYYTWLENQWGFTCQEVSTDYQFRDLSQAVKLTTFFFGNEMADKVHQNNWVRLPEWTGVWGKINCSER